MSKAIVIQVSTVCRSWTNQHPARFVEPRTGKPFEKDSWGHALTYQSEDSAREVAAERDWDVVGCDYVASAI
jgi:hypothetical protein